MVAALAVPCTVAQAQAQSQSQSQSQSQPQSQSQSRPARTGPGSEGQPLVAQPLPPAASGRSGSEVFRSVDENGTPSFSQTPPSGRASKPVDLKPLSGSIDSAKPASVSVVPPATRVAPPPPSPGTERTPQQAGPRPHDCRRV